MREVEGLARSHPVLPVRLLQRQRAPLGGRRGGDVARGEGGLARRPFQLEPQLESGGVVRVHPPGSEAREGPCPPERAKSHAGSPLLVRRAHLLVPQRLGPKRELPEVPVEGLGVRALGPGRQLLVVLGHAAHEGPPRVAEAVDGPLEAPLPHLVPVQEQIHLGAVPEGGRDVVPGPVVDGRVPDGLHELPPHGVRAHAAVEGQVEGGVGRVAGGQDEGPPPAHLVLPPRRHAHGLPRREASGLHPGRHGEVPGDVERVVPRPEVLVAGEGEGRGLLLRGPHRGRVLVPVRPQVVVADGAAPGPVVHDVVRVARGVVELPVSREVPPRGRAPPAAVRREHLAVRECRRPHRHVGHVRLPQPPPAVRAQRAPGGLHPDEDAGAARALRPLGEKGARLGSDLPVDVELEVRAAVGAGEVHPPAQSTDWRDQVGEGLPAPAPRHGAVTPRRGHAHQAHAPYRGVAPPQLDDDGAADAVGGRVLPHPQRAGELGVCAEPPEAG
mmetsp:Transcript_59411/g.189242  ORF Transcript_59411/g.189242 Transcript_59411/m.189242 type:complete len:499 (-) Transcript_59411:550-2046(-)